MRNSSGSSLFKLLRGGLAAALFTCFLAGCTAAPSSVAPQPPSSFSAPLPVASASSEPPQTSAPAPSTSVPEAPPASEAPTAQSLPEGFVYVADVVPGVLLDIRYYSDYNFVGTRIDGYEAPVAILNRETAEALAAAAALLEQQDYLLKIFDAYRPTTAVDHFARWAQEPTDIRMKDVFYPDIDKSRLFAEEYIATLSGHSRGSTVDLTLVNRLSGQELDMGSPFDFFGPVSHFGTAQITTEQAENREILKAAMEASGFVSYQNEWWHYVLVDEPYPDTYFDFPVA